MNIKTESEAYELTVQYAQVGSKSLHGKQYHLILVLNTVKNFSHKNCKTGLLKKRENNIARRVWNRK